MSYMCCRVRINIFSGGGFHIRFFFFLRDGSGGYVRQVVFLVRYGQSSSEIIAV